MDVWGLACLVWEAVTGDCLPMGDGAGVLGRVAATPAWAATKHEYLRLLDAAFARLRVDTGLSGTARAELESAGDWLVAVVSAMWSTEPADRPTAEQLLACPPLQPGLFRLFIG